VLRLVVVALVATLSAASTAQAAERLSTSDRLPDRRACTLNTAIAAVGEGHYGRLGAGQQQRWKTADRRLQLPAPDEQPGAMPEIAPSPLNGRSIDRPFNERPSVLQAWGAYGTVWPVVHRQLGARPDMGRGIIEVAPQVPARQDEIEGRQIRIGTGTVRLRARAERSRDRTVAWVSAPGTTVRLGHTLPADARIDRVRLDGKDVQPETRRTTIGLEVTARTGAGRHTLDIRTDRPTVAAADDSPERRSPASRRVHAPA